ncbi:MAG: T9SS type A sorting domain-containing protein [Bacteroidetes bacterium]|nr:T9SS type A sorting domain-containing protein [Bacteroidota bacterium]
MKELIAVLLLAGVWTFCPAQTMAPHIDMSRLTRDSAAAPIEALTTSIKDNRKVSLKWQSDSAQAESFFVVERSINGTDFNAVGIIKNSAPGQVEFVDDAPLRGKSYYRIKLTAAQTFSYSPIVSSIVSGDASCRFYPNPVDKALIIRSEWPVEVLIADKFGKPVLSSKLCAGLKIVDVSALEPGMYVITLIQKEANRIVTEKLVKK